MVAVSYTHLLCGRWSFLDFELIVGPGVLCPRADTEVVAETATQTLAGVKAPRVLDLCAGKMCIRDRCCSARHASSAKD